MLHEEDHGLVEHLKPSDHGALRYAIGSASVEVEPPAAADADAGGGKLSGAVWEQVSWFVGDESLSFVPLKPLTAKEKAVASLRTVSSRLFQVRKRGRLDFYGSDVAGVAVEGWKAKLEWLVSEAEQRLKTAKEEAGPGPSAMEVDGDEGAGPVDIDGGEAVLCVLGQGG